MGFVFISGFSIAHSYGQKPQGFYRRRFGRIFPTLFVSTLLFAVGLWIAAPLLTTDKTPFFAPSVSAVLQTIFGLNQWWAGSFFGPTWSLAIEIFFYAATPLLALLPLPALLAGIAISSLAYWLNMEYGLPQFPGLYGMGELYVFWAWGLGFVYYRWRTPALGVLAAGLGTALIARFNNQGGVLAPMVYAATTFVAVAGGTIRLRPGLRRALDYLGDLSYPLYLFHYPVIVLLNGVFGIRSYPVLAAVSFAASALCLHVFERPARAWIAGLSARQSAPQSKAIPVAAQT
jgi:peptidoglycan/LPS O-acetylase OafA/YrhL